MKETKRLAEMKAGDRLWFEGAVETIKRIERDGDHFVITFEDGTAEGWCCGACLEGDWAVPEGEGGKPPRRYVIRHKSSGRYLITVGHIGWTWGSREVATSAPDSAR